MKTVRFTKEGYAKLKKDLNDLLKSRPDAVLDLKKARDMGDLSENGYYKAAKSKLVSIDRNLSRFTQLLKEAIIVDQKNSTVGIGSSVVIKDRDKKISYKVVGDLEAEPLKGKISLLSPIGRAINGKKEGDMVEIVIPKGKLRYEILSVE